MSKKQRNSEESHEVGVSESGDTITVGDVGPGAAAAVGRGASASVTRFDRHSSDLAVVLAQWRGQMETKIDDQPDLSTEDKNDLKEQVEKIESEVAKGDQAEPSRLEKLINTLSVMAPDIFEVAVATLANPLAGIGLAVKKIGDKAKLEAEPRAS
jgi:predicted  nucleic acid-binding Zn-ribbon protein